MVVVWKGFSSSPLFPYVFGGDEDISQYYSSYLDEIMAFRGFRDGGNRGNGLLPREEGRLGWRTIYLGAPAVREPLYHRRTSGGCN